MRTGFTTPEPTDFYRGYDQSLSNISFEPQVSNWAKHNYPEELYDVILDDLMSVDVPQEYYQRSFDVPVKEIAQLLLLNNALTLNDGEEDGDADSDDELVSDNELEENQEDDAENGEVNEDEAKQASSSDSE